MKKILSILFTALIIISCGKDVPEDELILDYLTTKGITAEKANTGYYYVIDKAGTAPFATRSSTIVFNYVGSFLDDEVFDQSPETGPVEFPLFRLIEGWQQFIPLLGTGGKGRVWLPSSLAYGPGGGGSIPGSTPIWFEIELVQVK
jgi:FKBP-type peptidyl-prolyl cis-trans isomerase